MNRDEEVAFRLGKVGAHQPDDLLADDPVSAATLVCTPIFGGLTTHGRVRGSLEKIEIEWPIKKEEMELVCHCLVMTKVRSRVKFERAESVTHTNVSSIDRPSGRALREEVAELARARRATPTAHRGVTRGVHTLAVAE